MRSEPTVKIAEFRGLNNKAEPRALNPGDMVQADNVDIDDAAKIRRRVDAKRVLEVTNLTSSWATPDEERHFIVADGVLYQVEGTPPALSLVALGTGLSADETYWDTDGERVFVSNTAGDLVIDRARGAYPLVVPGSAAPGAAVLSSGSLPQGRYLATVVLEDAYGRQGPATDFVSVVIGEDGGGIQFDGTGDVPGYTTRFYLSRTNGDVLYRADQTVTGLGELGAPLEEVQQYGVAPPAGGPIAWHAGRLWKGLDVTEDGTGLVIGSEPYWPHLFRLQTHDFQVPGKVLMLSDVGQASLLVGTTRRILQNTLDGGLVELADYGVVPGHQVARDENGMVYFWTDRGMCRASPFQNLTDERVSVPPGDRCAAGIVKQGGFERVVALTRVPDGQRSDNER